MGTPFQTHSQNIDASGLCCRAGSLPLVLAEPEAAGCSGCVLRAGFRHQTQTLLSTGGEQELRGEIMCHIVEQTL